MTDILPVSALHSTDSNKELDQLRKAVQTCTRCDLYKRATQVVFGEGSSAPKIMLIGEQPGDVEDRQGKPFVGPAGRLLGQCLEEAGIIREQTYVTNAVKHFKWEPRGKFRIHKKPTYHEITACKPWLEAEVNALHPEVIVCLGATAAQSLIGKDFRVTQARGRKINVARLPPILATVHPSSILRKIKKSERDAERQAFVADLKKAASLSREKVDLPRAG